jgi:hypothetical protein
MQLNLQFFTNRHKDSVEYFYFGLSSCSYKPDDLGDPAERLWIALSLREGYLMIKLSTLKNITGNAGQYKRYSDYYLKRLVPLSQAFSIRYRPIVFYRIQPRGSDPDILVRFE